MIVADSSFLIEAILRDADLFMGEVFVAPDLALNEVVNVIWKHEALIRDLHEAPKYLDVVDDLISSEAIVLVRPDGDLILEFSSLGAVLLRTKKNEIFQGIKFIYSREADSSDKVPMASLILASCICAFTSTFVSALLPLILEYPVCVNFLSIKA